MVLWALVSLCGAAALAGMLGRRGARPVRRGLPRPARTLSTLRPGDVIEWRGAAADEAHHVVEVSYRLEAAGPWRALHVFGDGTAQAMALLAAGTPAPGEDEAWLLAAATADPARDSDFHPRGGDAQEVVHAFGERHRLIGRFRTRARGERLAAGERPAPSTLAAPAAPDGVLRPVQLYLYLYRGPGPARLLALRWDGPEGRLELRRGQARPAQELDILPGS